MSEAEKQITQWAEEAENFRAAEWDRLPEIYLYMDQVLTYMESQLHLFEEEGSSPLLTSSMVNNYVKSGVIPRPSKKKYTREHLAFLTVICMLKPVLSIPDIAYLIQTLLEDASQSEIYTRFCEAQSAALGEVCRRVGDAARQGDAELTRLAVTLSVEANARRAAAERILRGLSSERREEKQKH